MSDFLEEVAKDAQEAEGDVTIVVKYVDRHEELGNEIEKLEEQLKDKKEALRNLEEELIPEAMDQCRIKTFTSGSGLAVKINKIVKASLPTKGAIDKAKDERKDELLHRHAEGLKWLRDNQAEELIKTKLEAEFGKGKDNMAGDVYAKLMEDGIPVKKHSTVAPATLGKFVEEKIAAGVDVPKDTLGVFIGRKAKITKPKVA